MVPEAPRDLAPNICARQPKILKRVVRQVFQNLPAPANLQPDLYPLKDQPPDTPALIPNTFALNTGAAGLNIWHNCTYN